MAISYCRSWCIISAPSPPERSTRCATAFSFSDRRQAMTTHERIPVRISDQELARRWAALRVVMARRDIDAVVVQATNDWLVGNVKWLADIPANNGYPRTVLFYAVEPMTVVEMGVFGGRRTFNG